MILVCSRKGSLLSCTTRSEDKREEVSHIMNVEQRVYYAEGRILYQTVVLDQKIREQAVSLIMNMDL